MFVILSVWMPVRLFIPQFSPYIRYVQRQVTETACFDYTGISALPYAFCKSHLKYLIPNAPS